MRSAKSLILAASFVLAGVTSADHALACGGCFTNPTLSESTQVSGHRMIVSIGMEKTTLWDQITYAGNPESFAWVLPIKGTVEVGLSADALFQVIDARTQVRVSSPPLCDNSCGSNGDYSYGVGPSGGDEYDSEAGVEVLAHEVVGPYETVQLSAKDPKALTDWLSAHGYAVPDEVKPVVDHYVSASFDFLALKLVPGEGVSAMRPVRVTTPGAGFSLPLQMVAAGAGAVTPIKLWVLGAGRYEPANFPSFTIASEDLVWDWDTASSNYAALRKEKFAASGGFGWNIETSGAVDAVSLKYLVLHFSDGGLAQYADADGSHAEENFAEEVALLAGGFGADGGWITRMSAELSRAALKNDLLLGASEDQGWLDNYLEATRAIGTRPTTDPPCPPDPCAGPVAGPGAPEQANDPGKDPLLGAGAGHCNVNAAGGTSGAAGLWAALAAALAGIRNRRRRRASRRQ